MISIVMMSYLGHYPGARSNPIPKFNQAVQSVVDQTDMDWELIIVSDGCELTNQEYEKNWVTDSRIKLIKTTKSKSKWPGTKRQVGIDHASNEWITYLDSDDLFTKDRIELAKKALQNTSSNVVFDTVKTIALDKTSLKQHSGFPHLHKTQWGGVVDFKKCKPLPVLGENAYICSDHLGNAQVSGVFRIFHKRVIKTKWQDREKTGEDNVFIANLIKNENCEKKDISGYIIRHMSVSGFDI